MGTTDGSVGAVVKVVDHAPDETQLSIVFLGDGFTAPDLPDYRTKVQDFVTDMQAREPYASLWHRINIHRVDITSTDSGMDDPPPNPRVLTAVRTYFDGTFCSTGKANERHLIGVDQELAMTTATAMVPTWDRIIVLLNNSAEFAGTSTGTLAMTTTAPGYIRCLYHELGHTFNLADEYSWFNNPVGEAGAALYTGPEPPEPNVTTVTDRSLLKWRHLVTAPAGSPVDLFDNPFPNQHNPNPDPFPPGTVGLYEGGKNFYNGIYRCSFDCIMREGSNHTTQYCAVCREAITIAVTGMTDIEAPPICLSTGLYLAPAVPALAGLAHHWPTAQAMLRAHRHPDVVTLRTWRDGTIAHGGPAGAAMRVSARIYATLSPPATRYVLARPRLAGWLRRRITEPLAARLRNRSPVQGA